MKMRIASVFAAGLVGAMTVSGLRAVQVPSAEAALETGRKVEIVDGDVPGAIAQYRMVAETYKATNRPVAAQALVQLARAYTLIGDTAAARGSYARVVSEFGDQPAARIADVAVGTGQAGAQAVAPAKVLVAESGLPRISPDGRSFVEYRDGYIQLVDVATKQGRRLTTVPDAVPRTVNLERYAFSPSLRTASSTRGGPRATVAA